MSSADASAMPSLSWVKGDRHTLRHIHRDWPAGQQANQASNQQAGERCEPQDHVVVGALPASWQSRRLRV